MTALGALAVVCRQVDEQQRRLVSGFQGLEKFAAQRSGLSMPFIPAVSLWSDARSAC